ncbi:MAG: hypothetical protein R3E31_01915 [Chloroflexota bacterium]
MKHKLVWLLGLLFLSLAWLIRPVQAQSSCSHVDFRLDTTLAVDQTAVCQAAQPWADEGVRIFVYLTDTPSANEDEWFSQLDQIETAEGYRNGTVFEKNVLAFEATTASNAGWSTTLTYGELLYDTPLDQEETAVTRLKNEMRQAIQGGDATTAFVTAVEQSYSINNPPPSPVLLGMGALIGAGALGAGGYVTYRQLVVPAQRRARRRKELQEQLARLQQGIANLLLALEQLIAGSKPEDATLYQVFVAYGGKHQPARDESVRGWLAQCQQAFYAAFDLRRNLQSDEAQQIELEEQVRRWETLYLSLVGSSPRIRNLTEAELRDLLDPVVVLERGEQESQLVAQLRDISRQIQGMPLKVEMMVVKPDEVDQDGILGYLDQVEEQVATLMEAQQDAPQRLDEAQQARLSAEEEAASASPFGMTPTQLLGGIDERLTTAQHDLEIGAYVRALATAESVLRDVEIVEDLIDAAQEHGQRETEIAAILAEGFRPAHLQGDRDEIGEDIAQIKEEIAAGDYLDADDWIDELDTDSQRALQQTVAWRELYQFNQESLTAMQARLVDTARYLDETAEPAWNALQVYPAGNWQDILADLSPLRQTLRALHQEQFPAIETMNSMETQQFADAEAQLVVAGANLRQVERQLQALVSRLAEVETAVATLPAALDNTQTELDKAVRLRDAEDAKISPDVDQKLAEAAANLEQARTFTAQREFIAAVHAQTTARQLATDAYAAADAQVQQINQLQNELAALGPRLDTDFDTIMADAELLPPHMQTESTAEMLHALQTNMDEARRARAGAGRLEDEALAAALTAMVTGLTAVAALTTNAKKQISDDRHSYDRLRDETLAAIRQANRAVQSAEVQCRQSDAGTAGDHALQRARTALPGEGEVTQATRTQLQALKQRAQEVQRDADEAERKAREAIRRAQHRRQAAWTTTSSSWSSGSSWSRSSQRSSSRSSHRPSSRPSSSSSSRRSSSSSSSRRSSSGGSSRRSSSMGGSRRR